MIFRRGGSGGVALGTATPPKVALDSTAGVSKKAAAEDHTHAARVQRKVVDLDANGMATWTFSRPFDQMPSLQFMVFQGAPAQGVPETPIIVEAREWVMTGAQYTGVTVKGFRSQRLPVMAQLGLGTLLSGLLTGVNTLISTLTGFNVFGGGSLAGVKVHLSAGDQM